MIYIGIGNAGVSLCKLLKTFPEYKTFTIDCEGQVDLLLDKKQSPEEYESLDLAKLPFEDKEVTLIFSCGNISGITLKLTEQLLYDRNVVNLVYVMPDLAFLPPQKKIFHGTLTAIFQGLTRNGVIKSMCLIDNKKMSEISNSTGIRQYFNTINQTIVYVIHMSNGTDKLTPVFSTYSPEQEESSRIFTYSLVDLSTSKEKVFFDMKDIDVRKYFIMMSETDLSDKKYSVDVLQKCLTAVDSRVTVASMFEVFATDIATPFVACKISTSIIQDNQNGIS